MSARVAVVFGFIRKRRRPQPKVGRMMRAPGSVSRMMPIDWSTFSGPPVYASAPARGSGRTGKSQPRPKRFSRLMTPSPSVKSCHSHLHALLPLERDRQLDARRRIEISADLLRRLVRLMRAQSGVGKRSVAEFAEVKVCVGHLWSVLIEPGAGGDAGLKIDVQFACVERAAEARARVERAEGVNVEVHVEFYLRRDHVELRI